MKVRRSTIGAVAAIALVPGTAFAATITGGPGNERLVGTNAPDQIDGAGGNDRIFGRAGDDQLVGGPGNDTIFANAGQDTSYGGDGNDRLWALARSDVQPGPGGAVDQNGDALDGGAGDDVFRTRDGEVDRITCGDGNDRAFLDQVDVITDATAASPNGSCEQVVRRAPKPKHSKSEDAQQAPAEANRGS